jgi:hypothetical protein
MDAKFIADISKGVYPFLSHFGKSSFKVSKKWFKVIFTKNAAFHAISGR